MPRSSRRSSIRSSLRERAPRAPRAGTFTRLGLTLGVLGVLGATPAAAQQCQQLGPPATFSAAPGVLAPADYDLDGNADIAVGGVLLYGDGTGGFGAPLTVPSVRAMAAVDLGGVTPPIAFVNNAAPELVAESTANPTSVAVGLGTGIRGDPFSLLAKFPVVGSPPQTAAVADLTGDGIPDLVIGYGPPANVLFVWVGASMSPNWTSQVAPLQLPFDDPVALATGDFADDGQTELLALSRHGNALVEFRFVNQQFVLESLSVSADPTVSGNPTAMAVTDLDGDGFLDAVITTSKGDVVSLPGTGHIVTGAHLEDPAFGTEKRLSVGGNLAAIALGDVDGDRRTDAVVVNGTGGQVLPLPGDGKGGFQMGTPVAAPTPNPISVALLDLDHDGALDVVTGDASQANVGVLHNACTGSTVNIQITGMEVTQGIQDLGDSVVLVAGLPTFVRVHVSAGTPVDGVTARLARTDGSGTVLERPLWPSNPGGNITVLTAPDRSQIAQSFLFELPPAWTALGTLHLTATVNPDRLPVETTFADNTATRDATFQDTHPVKIELIKVRLHIEADTNGSDSDCGRDSEPTDAELDQAESALRRELPTAKLVITRASGVLDPNVTFPCAINNAIGVETGTILAAFKSSFDTANPDHIRLGLFQRAFIGGLADSAPGWFAVAQADDAVTSVHEVGHSLGRTHTVSPATAPCSAAEAPSQLDPNYPYPSGLIGGPAAQPDRFVGFDLGDATIGPWPALRKVLPPNTGDLMGYCQQRWSSDYTWNVLRNGANTRFSATDPAGDFLRVTGEIDPSGKSVNRFDAVRLPLVGDLSPSLPGKWRISQVDANGSTLSDRFFSPHTGVNAQRLLAETLTFAPGTRSIVLHDPAGATLGSIPVSAHSPSVGALTLSTGKLLPASGPVTVSWSASDPDGDSLLADLFWSRDGGATFEPIASGLSGSSYTFDVSRLAGTGGKVSGVLRVLVRDPVLTALTDRGGLSTGGSPPRVRIVAPFTGQTYVRGQTPVLRAIASDVEDGVLDGAVSWGSDRDGPLGAGGSIATRLSPGNHVLTARVVDSSGNVATASSTVQVLSVLPRGAPPVAVAGKAQTVTEGGAVVLDGRGSSDPDGDPLTYAWSVLQLPPGLQGLTLSGSGPVATFVPPRSGVYRFLLTVTDLRQGSSTSPVRVNVANVPPSVSIVTPASGTVLRTGPVTVHAAFTDPGVLETHTCSVVWDEDTVTPPVPGTLSESTRACTATRTLAAGVYSVRVTVRDDGGGEGVARTRLVVFDPDAGSVTGHGHIASPRGALSSMRWASGQAEFELRSAYAPGASRPGGEVELHLGRFQFRSRTHDWLVVSGDKAQVAGSGEVDGKSGFGFLLTAYDENGGKGCEDEGRESDDDDRRGRGSRHHSRSPPDRFRLEVWNRSTGVVVYDNVRGAPDDLDSARPQPIASGCITIVEPAKHPGHPREHEGPGH